MWNLSEEQQLIAESAEKLLDSEYDFESRKGRIASTESFDRAVWQQYAELGWLGISFDEMDGGYGGGTAELALLMHRFGRKLAVEPFLATVVLGGTLVARGANRSTCATIVQSIMAGECQLAVGFAEPGSRYDLNRVTTSARKSGDGFVLNGKKTVVLNAAAADHLIVSARTSGADDEERGISLFLVSRDAPGVSTVGYRLNDGHRAGDVSLTNVEVGADALIGDLDGGLELLEAVIDEATIAVSAEAVGAMETIMEMTGEYLKTREQFGRPIAKSQVLQFRMVEMHYALEESRSMVIGALEALDGEPAARRAMVSATKVRVGNAARQVGQEGIQLHGAIGMTEDYAVGHYYKRLETLRMLFGDPDHHLARYGRWRQARNAA